MQLVPFASSSTTSTYNETLVLIVLLSLLSLGVLKALSLASRLFSFATSFFRRPLRPPGVNRATQTTISPRSAWLLYCDSLQHRQV